MSVTFVTPTLQTERLILRAPAADDAPAFLDYFTSERSKYTAGPVDRRTAWNLWGTEIGHWVIRGFGMFVVCDRSAADVPLGLVGHWFPNTWPEKEVGWILFSSASEGKGYAAEAAKACVRHAYDVLGWESVVSYIDFGNQPSINLAERLGATHDTQALCPPGHDCLVYRHNRRSQ